MKFKAVIFDMDGLLIDSEPFWQEAEVKVFNSIGAPITKKDCIQTMGRRIDEVVRFWREKYPWRDPSDETVAQDIVKEVAKIVQRSGVALPGVEETIAVCKKLGMKLAIASSSFHSLIEVVITKLNIKEHFSIIQSAQMEALGKPHPAVYLTTAKLLGVPPTDCLVFEDSPSGVTAAKAAGMTCIAVPGEFIKINEVGHADLILKSLADFTPEIMTQLERN